MMDKLNEIISSMGFVMSGNTPVQADVLLTLLIGLAALSQWFAWGVSGSGPFHWRGIVAFGWTLWFSRFFWSILAGDDPIVPPVSAIAIALIASGAIARNIYDSRCVQCSNRAVKGIFSRAEDTKVK